jgi:hypothetical protein
VAVNSKKPPLVRGENIVTEVDGGAEKILFRLDNIAGKGGGYFYPSMQVVNAAVGFFKAAQVYPFMRGLSFLFIPPPFIKGVKQHSRLEDPFFKVFHIGSINFQQEIEESAFLMV